MFKLFCLLFIILVFDLFYVLLLNIKFGKALPISFISFFFIGFISGLIGNLSYYKYVVPCLFVILSIIVWLSKRKDFSFKKIIDNYFNLSFILFIALFIYMWFLYRNYGLSNIDDLFHWSLSVSTIVKSGTLFPVGWFINSYPPFVTWYIAMICYFLGGYSESFCLFALSNLCLSFIFPFLDKYTFKKKDILLFAITSLILILSFLCINITEFDQLVFVFNSIYIDWIMAILFAYLFYLVYTYSGEKHEAIYFSLILTALALTKQVSIPLSLICLFSLLIKQILNNKLKLINILIIIILPILCYSCWSILLKTINNSQPVSLSLTAVSRASSSFLDDSTSSLQISKDFVTAMFMRPIIFHPIKISYFFFVTCSFIYLLVYGLFSKKKKEYFSTSVIAYLGSFGFALVMLISYIAVIPDGYSIPLFSRYMQTYTFAYLLICIFLTIDNNDKIVHSLVILFIIVLLIEPKSINTICISDINSYYKINERNKINQFISDVYNNEKIGVLSQTDIKYKSSIMFMFYDNQKFDNVSFIQVFKQYDNDINALKDFLGQFEYLLIADHDTTLSNYWKQITDTPLYNSTIYKVNSSSNDIDIQLIEIFEDTDAN